MLYKYVINLPDRTDRRREMQRQLAKVGWRDDVKFIYADRPRSSDGFPSIGAHGCFRSHLITIEHGVAMGGHVLIMEDDLNFASNFTGIWEPVFDKVQREDWAFFYPGHTLTDAPRGLSLIDPNTKLRCAHFFAINKSVTLQLGRSLREILSRQPGDPNGAPMHVDGAYSMLRAKNPQWRTLIYNPSLGHQRPSRSDIAPSKFYDRSPRLRPIMNRLRDIKSRFS